jgi:hypothetical protein
MTPAEKAWKMAEEELQEISEIIQMTTHDEVEKAVKSLCGLSNIWGARGHHGLAGEVEKAAALIRRLRDERDEAIADLTGWEKELEAVKFAVRNKALDEAEKAAGNCNEDGSWTNSCNCKAVILALKEPKP